MQFDRGDSTVPNHHAMHGLERGSLGEGHFPGGTLNHGKLALARDIDSVNVAEDDEGTLVSTQHNVESTLVGREASTNMPISAGYNDHHAALLTLDRVDSGG
ncbi:unnamed protein product [Fusarium graminearum]|nr:unnamed protein product [Fusarium graminearum]